jgi:hypothetical protein
MTQQDRYKFVILPPFSATAGGDLEIMMKKVEEIEMPNNTKVKNLPKYAPGNVVDLTYKSEDSLPNRIKINAVYMREQDKCWMYNVTLENTGSDTSMSEPFISERKAKQTAPVYQSQEIMERYARGWRFCGNYPMPKATAMGEKMAANINIANIVLYPALNPMGVLISGSYGVWIRYAHIIDNEGFLQETLNIGGCITIK